MIHVLSNGTTTGHNFKRPLRTLTLEPGYVTSQTKAYVCGGQAGELVLTSKAGSLPLGGLENMFGLVGNLGLGGAESRKILHSGEGPIYIARWKGNIIAWANDIGVKLYSTATQTRIAYIDRPKDSPRADLFHCSLSWKDDATLFIAWADLLKVVEIGTRPKVPPPTAGKVGLTVAPGGAAGVGPAAQGSGIETVVQVTKVLRLDCMIAGVVAWPFMGHHDSDGENMHQVEKNVIPANATTAPISRSLAVADDASIHSKTGQREKAPSVTSSTSNSFLLLTYVPPKNFLSSEAPSSVSEQRRQSANPPELRIITAGAEAEAEESSSDILPMKGYERWGCTDYRVVESFHPPHASFHTSSTSQRVLKGKGKEKSAIKEEDHGGWLVLSPKGVIWVRKRDRRDRVMWLVEQERYEEALDEIEKMEAGGEFVKPSTSGAGEEGAAGLGGDTEVVSKEEIGKMYLEHLFKLSKLL